MSVQPLLRKSCILKLACLKRTSSCSRKNALNSGLPGLPRTEQSSANKQCVCVGGFRVVWCLAILHSRQHERFASRLAGSASFGAFGLLCHLVSFCDACFWASLKGVSSCERLDSSLKVFCKIRVAGLISQSSQVIFTGKYGKPWPPFARKREMGFHGRDLATSPILFSFPGPI